MTSWSVAKMSSGLIVRGRGFQHPPSSSLITLGVKALNVSKGVKK